jgi:hypothetical protein
LSGIGTLRMALAVRHRRAHVVVHMLVHARRQLPQLAAPELLG